MMITHKGMLYDVFVQKADDGYVLEIIDNETGIEFFAAAPRCFEPNGNMEALEETAKTLIDKNFMENEDEIAGEAECG